MKKKFLFLTSALAGLLVVPAIAIQYGQTSFDHVQAAEHTFVLDGARKLTTATNGSNTVKVKQLSTDLGNPIIYQYQNVSNLAEGFQTIGANGYIMNMDPIDGIYDLAIESNGDLEVEYSWFINKESGDTFVANENVVITSNNHAHFNVAPSFVKIMNKGTKAVDIKSITYSYYCKRVFAPFEETMTFDTFKTALNTKPATKTTNNMSYTIDELGITMKYDSTFTIDKDDKNVSKFDFSYDKLNDLDAEEIMSKVTGTYYTKGNGVFEVQNGKLTQIAVKDTSFKPKSINLDNTLLTNYSIDRKTVKLTANVKTGSEKAFLNTDKEIKNVVSTFELDVESETITKITTTYVSTIAVGAKTYNANVTTVTNYTYAQESVVLPL